MKDVMITNSDKVLGLDQKLNILIGWLKMYID
jgi:hypothetical protein